MKKCRDCGQGEMRESVENIPYSTSGLDGITLEGVRVRRCSHCGTQDVTIRAVAMVQKRIALTLAEKKEKLTPPEIRYLRKYLGLSSSDFARKMGVDPSTVSRWESIQEPQSMSTQAERLLRLMVLYERPVDDYPLEEMATLDAKPSRMRLSQSGSGWTASRVGG